MKNIIICCDGTGNQFGEENSNIVKLYSILNKNSKTQIAYYDPGVGTLSEPGFKTSIRKKISIGIGLAFGNGLRQNVVEAYIYLMENYEEGDKVFFFGFSRGAYTVRVLAAFIRMCGLLNKGCQNLIPYAYQLFENKNFKISKRFKTLYSKECKIHFLGVWDTVSSYGFIGNWKNFPYTANNELISIIRHALAIDEKRTYYKQNLLKEKGAFTDDIKQVWFAGVHSDVGGSYPEEESGLSKVSLQWMIVEAYKKGLEIDIEKYKSIVLGEDEEFKAPTHLDMIHKSLSSFWWVLEVFPRKLFNFNTKKFKYTFPLGEPRLIEDHPHIEHKPVIHQSVFDRMRDMEYKPENLPKDYIIEPIENLEYETQEVLISE